MAGAANSVQHYREGREDQLGALGMVLNTICVVEHHLHGSRIVCRLADMPSRLNMRWPGRPPRARPINIWISPRRLVCRASGLNAPAMRSVKIWRTHSWLRQRQRREVVADQLIDNLIALPLFAADRNSMFHADPHAGNLLYDERSEEAVILDWALTEQLTYEQRRHLVLLFVMIALRDSARVCDEIQAITVFINLHSHACRGLAFRRAAKKSW